MELNTSSHITSNKKKMQVRIRCNKCDVYFKNRSSLNKHQLKCSPQYRCHLCGTQYRTHSGLRGHLKWHNDVYQYKCEICQRYYKLQLYLHRHLKTKSHLKKCNPEKEQNLNIVKTYNFDEIRRKEKHVKEFINLYLSYIKEGEEFCMIFDQKTDKKLAMNLCILSNLNKKEYILVNVQILQQSESAKMTKIFLVNCFKICNKYNLNVKLVVCDFSLSNLGALSQISDWKHINNTNNTKIVCSLKHMKDILPSKLLNKLIYEPDIINIHILLSKKNSLKKITKSKITEKYNKYKIFAKSSLINLVEFLRWWQKTKLINIFGKSLISYGNVEQFFNLYNVEGNDDVQNALDSLEDFHERFLHYAKHYAT